MTDRIPVLVVGQTPPPYHGQAIMIQMLLDGPTPGVQLHHVRMAFSENMDQVGRFQFSKVLHLFQLIIQIIWMRLRHGIRILYYPPAGPNKVPILRDTILLLCTRWFFSKTVFHFQAAGMSELIPRLPAWIRFFARLALNRPDVAIQLSPLLGNDAKYLEAKQIYTIPNAADDHAEHRQRESHAEGNSNGIQMLYLGTVCETKGILVLLDACAKLLKTNDSFRLHVVGSFQPSNMEKTVRERIESLGLTHRVELHGQLIGETKWKMFSHCDIFCFPSHYESEGFPCVLVEAISFGLPIATTRWRGIPSIVADHETGLIVEPRDPNGLAIALERLISDSDLRVRLGRNARQRYEREFTRQRHLELMTNVFRDLSDGSS